MVNGVNITTRVVVIFCTGDVELCRLLNMETWDLKCLGFKEARDKAKEQIGKGRAAKAKR